METHVFGTDDIEAWFDYFDRLERAGPYHDPEYLAFLEDFEQGGERAELFVLDADDAFVYHPYLVRSLDDLPFVDGASVDVEEYADLVSSWYYGGPLAGGDAGGDDGAGSSLTDAFARAFSDHCRERGYVAEFVRFDPNLANHETFDCLDPTFERETVPVDLTGTKDELWAGFERRNRNAIRQGLDSGIQVEPSRDGSDIKDFYGIYTDAMEAVDAPEHYRFPLDFFTELIGRPDLATFLASTADGEVVGGSVVVHDQHIAHDYLRASDPDYWDERVNNLICYVALLEMRERGREVFDFQGGRPGVFRFKKGFSPDRREFHVGRRVHLPDVYDRLVTEAERAGLDTGGDYFPAYRVETSN